MKHLSILMSCLLAACGLQAQTQDSLYVWKAGQLVIKQSIKPADMDSITFRRPTPAVVPLPNVTICNQVWTTQNLDVTNYSDGTPIPQVTDPTQWANLTTGAWCYYNNDPANGAVYGKLYNWYAVAGIYDAASAANPAMRKKLAPNGWHIPTDAEWTTLTDCLGGESVAGDKMKATTLWQAYSGIINTNSSGFTGFPGGYRPNNGSFYLIGLNGYWWSSSEDSPALAWYRNLYYDGSIVSRSFNNKTCGFSVRCLRD